MMNWLFNSRVKHWIVDKSNIWFYSSKKLPVGTHFPLFTKERILFDLRVVFDVGANIGHFSKELYHYHPYSNFYCFEPFPDTFSKLKANLIKPNFLHFPLALGDKAESILVNQNEVNQSDTNSLKNLTNSIIPQNQVIIRIDTLDQFIEEQSLEDIDLLKIDTEGFDLKVLFGSEKSLKKGLIKLIYVECGLDPSNQYHIFFPYILSYLNSLNYVFIGFFQTDIRKIDRKIHFSNALFVHNSYAHLIETFV